MLLSKPTKQTFTSRGGSYAYWRCYYTDPHGKRRSVRVGRADGPEAISFRAAQKVALEMSAKIMATPAHAASMGRSVTLGVWVDKFMDLYAQRTVAGKPISPVSLAQAREAGRLLVEHFGHGARLKSLTRGSGRDFRVMLGRPHTTEQTKRKRTRSEATIRTMVRYASIICEEAARLDLMPINPFDREETTALARKKPYIDSAKVEKLIGQLPSVVPEERRKNRGPGTTPAELAALVGCVRWAGLRCDSETHALEWRGIDWVRCEMRVESPKTEGAGKAARVVPIQPRLMKLLLAWFESSPTGSPRSSRRRTAPRQGKVFRVTYPYANQLIREARDAAGLKRWPSLFHTLRKSFREDMEKLVGEGEAAVLLGHSPEVGRKFYAGDALRASEATHERLIKDE